MPTILLNADASGVDAVMPWLVDCKELCLLAGLGGRAGSAATLALAYLARQAGLRAVALVGVPFARWKAWGSMRRRQSLSAVM